MSNPVIQLELRFDQEVVGSRTALPPFIMPMAAVLITVSMVTASCSVTPFFLHEHGLPCRHEDAGKTEDRERAKVALQRTVS
jgi:hypothetical protein